MGKTLEEYLRERGAGRITYEILQDVYYRVKSGELKLRDPHPPTTFITFLLRLDYVLWFYTSLILAVLTIIVVWASGSVKWILPLRYVLGSIYVLFLPGYSLIEALYPEEGRLSDLERLALSLGLSLAIVPLIGLILNYTPAGIRLEPYIASSFTLIIILLLVAAYRKYRILMERLKASQAL